MYRIDLSKSAQAIIANRLNFVFGVNYRPDQVILNKRGAWPLSKEEARDKGVESKLAIHYTNGVYGFDEIYFTRADLTELLAGIVIDVPNTARGWSQDLVPFITERLGLQLDTYDIIIEPVPETELYFAQIQQHHPVFKGGVTVRFIEQQTRTLASLLTVKTLTGFVKGEFLNG